MWKLQLWWLEKHDHDKANTNTSLIVSRDIQAFAIAANSTNVYMMKRFGRMHNCTSAANDFVEHAAIETVFMGQAPKFSFKIHGDEKIHSTTFGELKQRVVGATNPAASAGEFGALPPLRTVHLFIKKASSHLI